MNVVLVGSNIGDFNDEIVMILEVIIGFEFGNERENKNIGRNFYGGRQRILAIFIGP